MKSLIRMAMGAAMIGSTVFAVDTQELLNKEAGVQNIKYENGVISTMIVVGKAAVPKALRRNPGRAAQYAGSKAQDDAQVQLTRFLSTKVKWGKTADGETAVKEEAASATDASGKETSAETSTFTETEMTKEQKAMAAQACISGLQVLCGGMDNSGRYTWVGALNMKAVLSVKKMSKAMNEAHAEVDDMGKAAKAKKAAEDANEINAIQAQGQQQQGEGGAAAGNAAAGGNRDVDILQGMQKPRSSVASDANDFL